MHQEAVRDIPIKPRKSFVQKEVSPKTTTTTKATQDEKKQKQQDIANIPEVTITDTTILKKTSTTNEQEDGLPKAVNLAIPFTSQAPEQNWEQPWQDACEEAVVLMLDAYYKEYDIDTEVVVAEIESMIFWQEKKDWEVSIDAVQIQSLLQYYTGLDAVIIRHPTIKQIKTSIAAGHPVYALVHGKSLKNKYFTEGGPEYHTLVIRGYTEDSFITNDPGTKWGKNFLYPYDRLMGALHDWNDGNVVTGTPTILVLSTNTP